MFKILPFLQFITYGLLSVPMNFYWQHAVEAYYPGFPSRADFANIFRGSRRSCSVRSLLWSLYSSPSILLGRSSKHRGDNDNDDDDEKKPKRWAPRARPSGLHNFTMKFLVDQTVAGVINIVLFLVLINYLQGGSWTRGWELVQEVSEISSSVLAFLSFCFAVLCTEIFSIGFAPDHDCSAQVSAYCLNLDVYAYSGRPTCCFWERLRNHLGCILESICGCLIIVTFLHVSVIRGMDYD